MSHVTKRSFRRDVKLQAVKRMETGESSSSLAAELGVKRTMLYRWLDSVLKAANRAANLASTIPGFSWHHVSNYHAATNTGSMQLCCDKRT